MLIDFITAKITLSHNTDVKLQLQLAGGPESIEMGTG